MSKRFAKLGVCIIGCGDMGSKHAAAWAARDDAEVRAVSSPTQARRDALAGKHGAKSYADAYEAIADDAVQAVSICTPAGLHAEFAVAALDRGKHVLCEKPLALSLEDADRMIEASERSGALLSTSFQYRGVPRVQAYRQRMRDGSFGGPLLWQYRDIREVRPKIAMHRRSGNGGVVIDMAGHFIDAMRCVTDAEPRRVLASGAPFGRPKPRLASIDDDDFALDAAMLQITFDRGHCLQLLLDWGMPEGFPEQRAEYLAGPRLAARVHDESFEKRFELIEGDTVEAFDDDEPRHACRVNGLADAIAGRAELEVTGIDGRIGLSVSLAAMASIETGREALIDAGAKLAHAPQSES